MTQFPKNKRMEKLQFFDIHTHKKSSKDFAIRRIRSLDICREAEEYNTFEKFSIGLHPWSIIPEKAEADLLRLDELSSQKNILAIGEFGFDKSIPLPMQIQEELFLSQLIIAHKHNLPMILHIVRAWEEFFKITKRISIHTPMIIHGFRGKPELASELIKRGFHLSFGPFFNPKSLALAYQKDKLLLESDNSNTNITNIYTRAAKTLSISIEDLATSISKQTIRIFPSILN